MLICVCTSYKCELVVGLRIHTKTVCTPRIGDSKYRRIVIKVTRDDIVPNGRYLDGCVGVTRRSPVDTS